MEKVTKYLSNYAIEEVRNEIREAHGNEVFFVGKTNKDKIVEQVKLIARGSEFAVPVVRKQAAASDVIIHNHPSGNLTPSENDLHISSTLGEIGISSYIVNNKVDDIYVIVEPFDKEEIKLLNLDKIGNFLKPDSSVAKNLDGYEFRPQQIEMIKQVADAFNYNKIAVIEAGTGVGKTMAYLLPAIYWAIKNKERCAVSTNTINLQEQIINKDIPFLQSVLNVEFKAVLVKGRGNYICLRKIADMEKDAQLMIDPEEAEDIETLIAWSKITKDGSKSDLNFIPKMQVWEKVAAESDTCIRSKCPFFKLCFVNLSRREAMKAHIIVVNHHLLFADLSVRSLGIEVAILPPYKRLILDEAHNIEDVSTSYLGAGITRAGVVRILGRLYRRKKGEELRGYLPLLISKLRKLKSKIQAAGIDKIITALERDLIPSIGILESLNDDAMDAVFNLVYSSTKNEFGEIKQRITPAVKALPLWAAVITERANDFLYTLKKFCDDLAKTISYLEDFEISFSEDIYTLCADIFSQIQRLVKVGNTIEQVLFTDDEDNVRWLEIQPRRNRNIARLRVCPLDIAEILQNIVYKKFDTIVLTSATLTVSGIRGKSEFDYFSKRIGLDLVKKERLTTVVFPPPFDYRKQTVVGIPLDIPAPDSPQFGEKLAELILKSISISNGRAFILFTSYGLLNLLHSKLLDPLSKMDIKILKQGSENRYRLLEKFKQDKTSVLFGTDSFWEGVDVPGEALESVIITKLPFKVPSEPVIEARIEAIKKRGGNPFMEYSVPQAVIKLKQGFGRLIRSKKDRGSILIFDKRIIEKFYGRIFVASLPDSKIIKGGQQQVFEEIERFFKNGGL